MNFKIIILSCLCFAGCGVKGPPRPPAGTEVPSYINNYLKPNKQASLLPSVTDEEKDEEITNKTESD